MDEAKRDITSLAGIYGAIDQDVQSRLERDAEKEHPVTLLLPVYREPDAFWFQSYLESAGPLEVWDADTYGTPLDLARAALRALAENKPRCRMQARRLFAVGAAARTFPDLEPDELAAAALGGREFELLEDSGARAKALAEQLRSTPDITDQAAALDAWWAGFRRVVPNPEDLGPRPCAAGLRKVTIDGDEDPVPTMKTVFDAPISFDAALRFLEPLNWKCFPSWCSMKKRGAVRNGVQKYRESVSFDCINKTAPVLTVDLDFKTKISDGPPRVATAEYRLSKDQPEHDVFVNEGYLEIRELAPEPYPMVRVTTSKTIKFRPEYGGPGLVLFLCHIGYMSMVEDLVCCASKAPGQKGGEYPDIPFPGRTPPEAAQRAARGAPGLGYGGLIKVMVDQAAGALEECIDEFAKAARTSYEKIEAKSYKADDLVQDVADSWVRMLSKGASVANAGLRGGPDDIPR